MQTWPWEALAAAATVGAAIWLAARVLADEIEAARAELLLVAALLVVAAATAFGAPPLQAGRLAAVFVLCLAVAETDLRRQIVPDALVAALLVVAIGASHPHGWATPVAGAAATGGLFLLVRQLHFWWRGEDGLGLGDVKLAAAMGALLGAEAGLLAAAAAAAATIAWIGARRFRRTSSEEVAGAPFGVGLAAATAATAAVSWTAAG